MVSVGPPDGGVHDGVDHFMEISRLLRVGDRQFRFCSIGSCVESKE